jgi:DNA-binding MarR family transcriptional regulator
MRARSRRAVRAACAQVGSTCACFAIRKAARVATQLYDEVLQSSGLRVTQLTLLVAINLADSVSITALGEKLLMDRTTMTRNLKPLQRQGLIAIGRGKDRRFRVVSLTARGHEALGNALPLWRKAQARFLKKVGPTGGMPYAEGSPRR